MDSYTNLVFLNSHPIQYFVPLYQKIEAEKAFDLTVLYSSDETINGYVDKQFSQSVTWDIPLLEGYKSIFLKNFSLKPSLYNGFWGLINWGIVDFLRKAPKSIVVVHGWAYFTNILCIITAKLYGHKVCLRAETPLNQELKKNKTVTGFKNLMLRFLFFFIDYALYIGQQNELFYRKLNINKSKLLFTPYCVDNDRFSTIAKHTSQDSARSLLNLPSNKKIILFSGKYILKKNPLHLLEALNLIRELNVCVVFVGEGELRDKMEDYSIKHQLDSKVVLTGFVNQSLIPYYYAAADVFVMPSGLGETWGLSVNEAVNFGIPVIVSDTCGCAYDLVKKNGIVYKTGDIQGLADAILQLLSISEHQKEVIKRESREIMQVFSYETIIHQLKKIELN